MRRLLMCALVLALGGLGGVSVMNAQEKVAAPKAEACAAPCLEKICIAVPDKTKTSKVEYSCTTKDICLLKCPKFLKGGCCESGCADCGKPRTVNVLMKRVVITECDSTKCIVTHREAAPKCAPACKTPCPAPCTTVAPAAGAKTVAAPAQAAPQVSTPVRSVEPTR